MVKKRAVNLKIIWHTERLSKNHNKYTNKRETRSKAEFLIVVLTFQKVTLCSSKTTTYIDKDKGTLVASLYTCTNV